MSLLRTRGALTARRAAVGLLVIAGTVLAGAGVAAAATATVGNTDGDGLNVRAEATSASASRGLAWDGDRVSISCQQRGQTVTNTKGFSSNLWDFVPSLNGYLADAYMNTGYDGQIPGVPSCNDTPPSTGDYRLISQFQGQVNQRVDCGPTSVVMALLKRGVTPRNWNSGNPAAAINAARADMGFDPSVFKPNGTNESDVIRALAANGVSSDSLGDLNAILSHVRGGRPAILAGNLKDAPWSGQDVAHFMVVAGYEGGQYLVLDPANAQQIHYTSASVLGAYFDNYLGRAGVVLY